MSVSDNALHPSCPSVHESPILKISFIIPMLNEAEHIEATLTPLQPFRSQGHEVIVVDGGSEDSTVERAIALSDHLLTPRSSSDRGRALQMNRGAVVASKDLLLFLHSDTQLTESALAELMMVAQDRALCWGRFDVKLSGKANIFRLIERMMNLRSRVTSIATGDQAIFVSKTLFQQVGCYGEMPLMEDINLSKKLKAVMKPICIDHKIKTSSRRWEQGGVMKTVLLMWSLRLGYWLGVDEKVLASFYRS